ncbi:MAG TPA: uracil-DNA glycosylase [Candidatus Paceibacterota bacterium]|nr:uracil-DNA glycosylase [Candidatus Paceibacterota bacterium]
MPEDRTEQLRKIKEEVLNLKESPLYQERVKNGVFPVIGEGNHQASIMFIGEAPGRNEAKTGRPFCGAAGKLLDQMLASVGIQRSEVYITNIVKDRPPMNRDPLPEEIAVYGPYLDRQIEIIQPKVIVTLGRFSMDYIMRKFNLGAQITSISRMHGQTFSADFPYGQVTVIPLYHPAVAIYNQSSKEILMEDFKILKKFN